MANMGKFDMKNLFYLVTLLLLLSNPCFAIQNSSSSNFYSSQPTKIYDKNGSLQGYVKPQQNGTVKTYNKYNSYTGYYKKSGSQTRYYPKK